MNIGDVYEYNFYENFKEDIIKFRILNISEDQTIIKIKLETGINEVTGAWFIKSYCRKLNE